MKITPKVRRFQDGGAVDQGAPDQGGQGQDPMQAILQGAAQAVQNQDCQMAIQVCQALVQLAQGQQGGAPEQGQPVYRKGGRLIRRVRQ